MEDYARADTTLQLVEDPTQYGLKEFAAYYSPWRNRLLAGTAACGEEPKQELQELQSIGHLCWSTLFLKVCTLWNGPTLE